MYLEGSPCRFTPKAQMSKETWCMFEAQNWGFLCLQLVQQKVGAFCKKIKLFQLKWNTSYEEWLQGWDDLTVLEFNSWTELNIKVTRCWNKFIPNVAQKKLKLFLLKWHFPNDFDKHAHFILSVIVTILQDYSSLIPLLTRWLLKAIV